MTGQDSYRTFLVLENKACNVRATVLTFFRVPELIEAKGSEGKRGEAKRSKKPRWPVRWIDGRIDDIGEAMEEEQERTVCPLLHLMNLYASPRREGREGGRAGQGGLGRFPIVLNACIGRGFGRNAECGVRSDGVK